MKTMGFCPASAICFLAAVVALMMPENTLCDSGADGVQRDKGVGDCTVMVGFWFHHKIPDDAFSGDVQEYRICNSSLPPWMEFDPSTATFSGFAREAQTDSKTFICVEAIGKAANPDGSPSSAQDVFSCTVDVGLTPAFACPVTDSVVLATVYTDLTLPALEQQEIYRILTSVGIALDILPKDVRFTRYRQKYNPERNPVLFSGKGDLQGPRQNVGARVQFQVCCSGNPVTSDNRFVKYLEQNAENGELARVIGFPVIDWVVAKGFPRGNAPRE